MKNSQAVKDSVYLENRRATFETENMIAEIADGRLARLFNRKTGTEFFLSAESKPSAFCTGLLYAAEPSPSSTGPEPMGLDALPEISVAQEDSGSVAYVFRSTDRATTMTIRYAIDSETGDLLVMQEAHGPRAGLAGIRFDLGPVTCRGNLLFPFLNGIKASKADALYPFETRHLEWPMGWSIPVALFDDAAGGFWVHTQDAERHYKDCIYQYEGDGVWNVAFDTLNPGPFKPHTSANSVTWRINTYVGDWRVPVRTYKEWFSRAFGMPVKTKSRPQWVYDLRLVLKGADYVPADEVMPFLDLLAECVAPEKTLLFLENWKKGEGHRDVNLPNFVASDHGVRFNTEARKRGFRTMYFANYFAIDENHELFEQFRPHTVTNPFTGEHEGFNLKGEFTHIDYHVRLYYVNPAYKPWRDLLIGQFKALFDACPADGLFLDQSFVMYNDGNGLIDGMTLVEGNLAYHRELSEALPGVVIGGEGANEITCQYASLCEYHYLSMKIDKYGEWRGWLINPEAFDRMVPVLSEFLLPETRPIGYVGFPNARSPLYEAWRDALYIYRGVPTLARVGIDELKNAQSEARRVIRNAMNEGNG